VTLPSRSRRRQAARDGAKPLVTALFWILDVNGTTVSHGEVVNEYWTLVMVSQLPRSY